jgi:hypothetical protein
MLTRRITISACALCLAVPAAAGAQPIRDPAAGHADRIGSLTAKQLAAAYGTTEATAPARVAMGPSGTTEATAPARVAMGPSGTTKATAPARVTVASDGDGTNGWRIAAGSEAALLAALALGSALILRARRSVPRMGM